MNHLHSFFVSLALLLVCATDASPQDERTVEQLEQKITEVEADENLDEAIRTKALEDYRAAVARLKNLDSYATRAKAFADAIATAAGQAAEIRATLGGAPPDPAEELKAELEKRQSVKELEPLVVEQRSNLANLKTSLDGLDNLLNDQEGRPARIQEELKQAGEALESARKELAAETPQGENPVLSAARRELLLARQRKRLAEINMLEQEAASHAVRLDLKRAEREVAAREFSQANAKVKLLEERLGALKAAEAERARQEAEAAAALAKTQEKHPGVVALLERNTALNAEHQGIVERFKKRKDELTQVRKKAEEIGKARESTERMLKVASYTQDMAQILIDERRRLPSSRSYRARTLECQKKLDKVIWRLHEVDEKLVSLAEIERFLAAGDVGEVLRALGFDPNTGDTTKLLAELQERVVAQKEGVEKNTPVEAHRAALQGLQGDLGNLRKELVDLVFAERELVAGAETYAILIDEKLMWMPSTVPLELQNVRDLGPTLWWLINPAGWLEVLEALPPESASSWVICLLALLTIGALLLLRRKLRGQLATTAARVGKVHTDSFETTLQSLLATILLALPIPLALWLAGHLLAHTEGFPRAVRAGLEWLPLFAFVVTFWRLLLVDQGVAVRHFRWNAEAAKFFRRHFALYGLLSLGTIFILRTVEATGDLAQRFSLGRLTLIVIMLLATVFTWILLRPGGLVMARAFARNRGSLVWRTRHTWFALMIAVFVSLSVLAVLGYYYAVRQLQNRLLVTTAVIASAILIHALVIRWLAIAHRRLAFAMARERREAALARVGQASEDEAALPMEDEEFDLAAINVQTRHLVRTLLGLGVLLALYFAWTSVFPALKVLDEVTLWSYEMVEGGETKSYPVTLASLAGLLLIVMVTVAAARNLPGVLEIGILQRLPLDSGARYAIKAIAQYVLVAIGMVLTFNALGLNWSEIQWLVAALSVGLGFGLQEIFANFVSGLIIFFERRVRVGDVVTIDAVDGTVTRIRLLGTTITDWDRREYIVPNKDFITGRLLNWTLSDNLIRTNITVGVAYGSDTQKARELLLKVATEHPLILAEPAPSAIFNQFGDSSLNLVLRFFLPDLSNRLATITALHEAIDREFKAAGLEIAFPQRDLHIRSADAALRVAVEGEASDC